MYRGRKYMDHKATLKRRMDCVISSTANSGVLRRKKDGENQI